jgi:hypothetical protein
MSPFFYLVAEGVHDAAFLGKLLTVVHNAKRIKKLEDLDEPLRNWVTEAFKWPRYTGKHHDIERLAVPAPMFYRLDTSEIVALRNAQGIGEIGKTLVVDLEAFSRARNTPRSIGVVLDSDDEDPDRRFAKLKSTLEDVKLVAPPSFGSVSAGALPVGAFAMPAPGVAGTLEDVLLALGDAAYPALIAAARSYATQWRTVADGDPTATDWKEIRKPAGTNKATISAMVAVLKPGKATTASLEDHRWVCDETKGLACMRPILTFLNALFASSAPAPTPVSTSVLVTSP